MKSVFSSQPVVFLCPEQRGHDTIRIRRQENQQQQQGFWNQQQGSKQRDLLTTTILRSMMEVGWENVKMGASGHPTVAGGDPTELSAGQLLEKGFHELKVELGPDGVLIFCLPVWRTTKPKYFLLETEKSLTLPFGILGLKVISEEGAEAKKVQISFKPSALLLAILSGELVQRVDHSQHMDGYAIMLMICLKVVMSDTCHPAVIALISFALIYSSFLCFRELCVSVK